MPPWAVTSPLPQGHDSQISAPSQARPLSSSKILLQKHGIFTFFPPLKKSFYFQLGRKWVPWCHPKTGIKEQNFPVRKTNQPSHSHSRFQPRTTTVAPAPASPFHGSHKNQQLPIPLSCGANSQTSALFPAPPAAAVPGGPGKQFLRTQIYFFLLGKPSLFFP